VIAVSLKPEFPEREPHKSLLAWENGISHILAVALLVGLLLYWFFLA
jgi:hypothetical protein